MERQLYKRHIDFVGEGRGRASLSLAAQVWILLGVYCSTEREYLACLQALFASKQETLLQIEMINGDRKI